MSNFSSFFHSELPNFDLADVSFKDCKKDVSRCEAASIRDCMRLNLLTCVLKEFRHDSTCINVPVGESHSQ